MRGRPPPPGRRRAAQAEEEKRSSKTRAELDRERKSQEVEYSAAASKEAIELINSDHGQVEVEVCLLRIERRRVRITAIEDDTSKVIGDFSEGDESFNVTVPLSDNGARVFRLKFQVSQDKKALGDVVMTRDELLLPRLGQFAKSLGTDDSSSGVGWLEMRLHIYARVVVSICKATQLRSADLGGTSDPYAVCGWVGHKSRRLGRTQTITKCLNPQWNHPLIVLVPLLRPFHGGHMSIDVFDDDWMMGRDDFLGRAVLDGEFILRYRTSETNMVTLPLKGRHARERAQGSIDLRIFMHQDLYALSCRLIDDVTQKTTTLNDIPRVHVNLTVLRANGLRSADCCGLIKGDPYAVVTKDGTKVGRTPTVSKSIDPVWDRKNTFKLLDVPTQLSTKVTTYTNKPTSESPSLQADDESSRIPRDSRKDDENSNTNADTAANEDLGETESASSVVDGEKAGGSIQEARDEAATRGEPFVEVRVDLFDDDTVSRDFLGTANLTWRQLMSPGDHELVLADHSKTKRRHVRGTVTVNVKLEAVVSVVINEGVGLAQHDPYDISDPYAVAKWGGTDGTVVAKTRVRDNNLDPKWYGPAFELAVPIIPGEADELNIEVWEKDTWSSDDFMGLVCVTAEELLRPSPALPRFLTRRPGKAGDPFPQGYLELELHASFVPNGILEPKPAKKITFHQEGVMQTLDAEPQVEVCLRVLRAGGLLRQDLLGGADPFVQLRLNGKLIGKTRTQHNTLKPVWKSREAFYFSLPINADGSVASRNAEARIEVWNSAGFLGRHQLMGVTRIGARELLTPNGITRYALTPENPSAQFLKSPDTVYPGLGWIEICVKVSAQITLEVLKADGLRAADESGTSDPYAVVRWEGPDAHKVARCAAEKRTLSPQWIFSVPLSVPMTQPECDFAAVVVEVWDHDTIGSHDFLGLCVIDSLELLSSNAAKQETTRRLLNRDKRREALGTVTFKVDVPQSVLGLRQRLVDSLRRQKTSNVLDGTHVKFEILRATRLPNKDGRFGISDPYVRAYANAQKIGATSVVSNSLDPIWPGDGTETFTLKNFPTFGDASKNENFMVRLSIYDSDTLGRDDFMGEAALTWDLLMKAGTHSLPVKGRVFDPRRAGEKAVAMKKQMEAYYARRVGRSVKSLSTSRVEAEQAKKKPDRQRRHTVTRETPTLVVRVWHVARVRLHLSSAHQLRAADVGVLTAGKSDPYATVRYRGKIVAKTKVLKSTLDPRWYACFELEVPTFEPKEGAEADALVEIFDKDIVGSDDFLGCVVLTQGMMLRPHYGDIFELGPRPNAKVGDAAPTGFVDLKIESSFIPFTLEPIDWPRDLSRPDQGDSKQQDDELAAYEKIWGGREILTARDKQTGKRYWYETLKGGTSRTWWDDPRPPPPRPLATFSVPAVGPRPIPTKRKYAKFNERKHGEPDYEFRPTAVVEVNALRAGNLKKTDRFGLSDPYAAIRHGPSHAIQTVGRTRVVSNSLDPVWSDTPFRFSLPLDSECGAANLVVELWDSDNKLLPINGGRDDALGMCMIKPFEFLNAVSPIRRMLRPQPGEEAVTGWVEVRTSVLGRIKVTVEDVRFEGGTLENENDIKKRLLFEPTLKGWCETELERVRLFRNDENESMKHVSSFDVDIALQRAGVAVEIQVIDEKGGHRIRRKQQSLGVAIVSGEDLLEQDIIDVPVVASNIEDAAVTFLRLKVDCPDAIKKLARACWAAREIQETCNVLPQVAAIDTEIIRATNLKKADAFSLSDPYVKGWSHGSLVGQTAVKMNTLNPSWEGENSATFRLENVRTLGDDLTLSREGKATFKETTLLLEVWDSDGAGRRGTFLGHCVLKHEDLMSAGEKELTLLDRDKLIDESSVAHHGTGSRRRRSSIRRCCGACCAPCQVLACVLTFPIVKLCGATIYMLRKMKRCCFRRKGIQGKLIVRIRHRAQVKLRILEGYALPWADTTFSGSKAKSDPYCVVEFGGKKVAKTKVRANTNDPCFYEEVEISLEVPTSTFKTDSNESNQLQSLPWDHPGRAFQPAGNDALLVSVYDHDTLSADDLLGQVVVRPQFLLAPQNGTHWRLALEESTRGYLEIHAQTSRIPGSLDPIPHRQHGVLGTYREAVDKRTGRRYYYDVWTSECFWIHPAEAAEQSGVKIDDRGRPIASEVTEPSRRRKKSSCLAAPKPEEMLTLDPDEAQAVLSILVARATNLAAADSTGTSDPYAVVKLGDIRVGKTSVKSKSLDPEWLEVIPVVLPLGSSADLTIEVYDHDRFGSDDFLGAASFNSKLVMEKTEGVLSLPLRGRPGGKAAKGELTLHLTVAVKVVVEVLCAEKLTQSEHGWYCVTSWHGRQEREVSRTATVYDKLSRWNERVAVAVPLHFQNHDRLRLEVREHNRLGRDTTIGKIELDATTLLADFPANEYTGDIPVLQYSLRDKDEQGLSEPHKGRRDVVTTPTSSEDATTLLIDDAHKKDVTADEHETSMVVKTRTKSSLLTRWRGKSTSRNSQTKKQNHAIAPSPTQENRMIVRDSCDTQSESAEKTRKAILSIRIQTSRSALTYYASALLAWRQRPSSNVLPKTFVELEILKGDSLRRADFFGKSDPFVEVLVGNTRFRTKTVKSTLSPRWDGESFTIPALPGHFAELRVFDEDTLSKPDLLGYLSLDYRSLTAESCWQTKDLAPDPNNKSGEIEQNLGTLTFRTRLVVEVRISIVGVYELALNDSMIDRVPDAYASVTYLGRSWGTHTKVRSNTRRPLWYHTVELQVPVPVDGFYGDPALVTVYDKNTLSQDTVIGTATLPHESLIYPHDHPGTLPILDLKSNVTKGWLEVQVDTSYVPGRVEPRRRPEEAPVFAKAIDPRTDKPYWYDVCTGERYSEDPRPAAEALAEALLAERQAGENERALALPVALLRTEKGYPEPPKKVTAAGQATAARVWWTLPESNGPPVVGYVVERQRRVDKKNREAEWRSTGTVYVSASTESTDADTALAGGSLDSSTSVLIGQLADGALYRFRVSSENEVGRSAMSEWSNEIRVSEPLPEGWVEIIPKNERPYFYNAKTQQSSWTSPQRDPYHLPTELFLKFSQNEMDNLKSLFTSRDEDQSHTISLLEFEACLPEMGEALSQSDVLWLFHQADNSTEMNFCNFCRAINEIKRVRRENAPMTRRLAARLKSLFESRRGSRVGRAGRALLASKENETKARCGGWTRRVHPEGDSDYWVNVETGESSYTMPAEVRFFVPEALMAEASLILSPETFRSLEKTFAEFDQDVSGSIDATELRLLVERLTGKRLSDARIKGLIREVDADGSGEVEFDELVLILVTLRKKGSGGQQWAQLVQKSLPSSGDSTTSTSFPSRDEKHHLDVKDKEDRRVKVVRQRHGPYCVCGCRRLFGDAEIRHRKKRSVFPRLQVR